MKDIARVHQAWDDMANSLPLSGWTTNPSCATRFLIAVREGFGHDVKLEWTETSCTLNGVIMLTATDTAIFAHFKNHTDYNRQVLASPGDPLGQRHRLAMQ